MASFFTTTTSSRNWFSFEPLKCFKFGKWWALERKTKRALALEVEGRFRVVFLFLSLQESAMLVEGATSRYLLSF